MSLCVYLAAPYAARNTVQHYAKELAEIGYRVTCQWIAETHDITPGTTGAATDISDEQITAHAQADLDDIVKADILVAFTAASVLPSSATDIHRAHTGGRHVETGYALALGKRVLVVGDPENVFHRLPKVTLCPNWHSAVLDLSARLVAHERDLPQAGVAL